jgi:hypothetical protein
MEKQSVIGMVLILLSALSLVLTRITVALESYEGLLVIVFVYLVTLFVPGLLIELIFSHLESGKDISKRCGGLENGGYLIGYTERSLVFIAFLIAYYDAVVSFTAVLSFLSVVVAAKAIFRYSSRDTTDRVCADWYILGTLMSITMALAFSWIGFRFLLVG